MMKTSNTSRNVRGENLMPSLPPAVADMNLHDWSTLASLLLLIFSIAVGVMSWIKIDNAVSQLKDELFEKAALIEADQAGKGANVASFESNLTRTNNELAESNKKLAESNKKLEEIGKLLPKIQELLELRNVPSQRPGGSEPGSGQPELRDNSIPGNTGQSQQAAPIADAGIGTR